VSTTIQFLRSLVSQLRPDPTTLSEGMPMANLHEDEPGLYFRLRDDSLCKIGPCHVSGDSPNSEAQGFLGNSVGEIWLDTSDPSRALLKIWGDFNGQNKWIVVGAQEEVTIDGGNSTTSSLVVINGGSAGSTQTNFINGGGA
jgi:hypothetical protein